MNVMGWDKAPLPVSLERQTPLHSRRAGRITASMHQRLLFDLVVSCFSRPWWIATDGLDALYTRRVALSYLEVLSRAWLCVCALATILSLPVFFIVILNYKRFLLYTSLRKHRVRRRRHADYASFLSQPAAAPFAAPQIWLMRVHDAELFFSLFLLQMPLRAAPIVVS